MGLNMMAKLGMKIDRKRRAFRINQVEASGIREKERAKGEYINIRRSKAVSGDSHSQVRKLSNFVH